MTGMFYFTYLVSSFPGTVGQIQMSTNRLKQIRESVLMSKAELARKANISPLTISRIEKGMPCRIETQRKILVALGYRFSEKNKVFRA